MVAHVSADRYAFRVYLPDAATVDLVGTFTGWQDGARRMTRDNSGWWSITMSLCADDHEFSYLVNGSAWLPDYAAGGIRRNGFGGWVSQLHVPAGVIGQPREFRKAA